MFQLYSNYRQLQTSCLRFFVSLLWQSSFFDEVSVDFHQQGIKSLHLNNRRMNQKLHKLHKLEFYEVFTYCFHIYATGCIVLTKSQENTFFKIKNTKTSGKFFLSNNTTPDAFSVSVIHHHKCPAGSQTYVLTLPLRSQHFSSPSAVSWLWPAQGHKQGK